MNRIFFFCIFLSFPICSFAQGNTLPDLADHYQTDNFDVAIFPEASSDFFPGKGRFTPTKGEILQAEKALSNKLKELNADRMNQSESPVIDKNLRKYKRQYFGYLDASGNKILFINCFWKKDKDETLLWLKERIRVLGGASFYWNVKYNLSSDELFDLEVNGQG